MPKSLAGFFLRDLEYMEAVVEFKHFRRAAERDSLLPALAIAVRRNSLIWRARGPREANFREFTALLKAHAP